MLCSHTHEHFLLAIDDDGCCGAHATDMWILSVVYVYVCVISDSSRWLCMRYGRRGENGNIEIRVSGCPAHVCFFLRTVQYIKHDDFLY